jgi:hypothetical protein
VEEQTASWLNAVGLKRGARTIFLKHTREVGARRVGQDDVAKTLLAKAAFKDVRKLAAWLSDIDDVAACRGGQAGNEHPDFVGDTRVSCRAFRGCELEHRLAKARIVALGMRFDQPPEDVSAHGLRIPSRSDFGCPVLLLPNWHGLVKFVAIRGDVAWRYQAAGPPIASDQPGR